MRELKLHIWCDDCFDTTDYHAEAQTSVLVTVPGKPAPVRIDLCERSYLSLAAPLRAVLSGASTAHPDTLPPALPETAATGTGSDKAQWQCPFESCSTRVGRAHAISHLYQVHVEGPRPVQPTRCAECDWPGRGKKAKPQGMAAHRRTAHGWDAYTEALQAAQVAMAVPA